MLLSWMLAAAVVTQATDSLMGPGVSQALARYRAAQISVVGYDLALRFGDRDTVQGSISVSFERRGTGDVILDFRGYGITDVVVNGERGKYEFNGAHIRLAAAQFKRFGNRISMRFKSPIAPSGAAIIRFTDETDKQDYFYSLLVPADANLFFPCFDQPDIKARFTVHTSGDERGFLTNAPLRLVGRSQSRDGAIGDFHQYETSEPISTYLFAVAVGPWTTLKDATGDIALYVRRSRASHGHAG
jgi:aminopeptidase N